MVEFASYDSIVKKYGEKGITRFKLDRHGVAEISDDTQMSLFTAAGILLGMTRGFLAHGRAGVTVPGSEEQKTPQGAAGIRPCERCPHDELDFKPAAGKTGRQNESGCPSRMAVLLEMLIFVVR